MVNKYRNKKVVIDGYNFQSKDESLYYLELLKLKGAGEIINFELQPVYELQPSFSKYGKKHRAIKYIADFVIYNNNGGIEVIDVKGVATEGANLKRKLFDNIYPEITLIWVSRSIKHGGDSGWLYFDELKKIRAKNKKK